MKFPRFTLRAFSAAAASICGALLISSCQAEPDYAKSPAYDAVSPELDAGGAYYVYMNGEESFQAFEKTLDAYGKIFGGITAAASRNDPSAPDFAQLFGSISAVYRASGLADVDGFGSSAAKLKSGLYREKGVLHRPEGKAQGFVWQLFGRPAHPLDSIKMLPPSTSMACFSDLDINTVRASLKASLKAQGKDLALAKIAELEAKAKAEGFDIDEQFASLDDQIGYIVSFEDGKVGGMPFPSPGFASFIKVKDDRLFNFIAAKAPELKPVERNGAKVLASSAQPTPMPLRPMVALKDSYLIFASSEQLMNSVFMAMDGGPNITSSSEFQRLSEGVKLEGNAFFYYDNTVGVVMKKMLPIMTAMSAAGGANQDVLGMFDFDYQSFRVVRQIPGGIAWHGNSSSNKASIGAAGIAPMAVMAGMLLPALNSAREKARRISCAANLKQLMLGMKQYAMDHTDKFPEPSGAAGLEVLRKGDYITDPKIYVCPTTSQATAVSGQPLTEATVSYVYLGGFSEAGSPELPLVFDKPGNHASYFNVGFLDGHVQGFSLAVTGKTAYGVMQAYLAGLGSSLSEKDKAAVLQKAKEWDAAQSAKTAAK